MGKRIFGSIKKRNFSLKKHILSLARTQIKGKILKIYFCNETYFEDRMISTNFSNPSIINNPINWKEINEIQDVLKN